MCFFIGIYKCMHLHYHLMIDVVDSMCMYALVAKCLYAWVDLESIIWRVTQAYSGHKSCSVKCFT